jgi:hypothetical protein
VLLSLDSFCCWEDPSWQLGYKCMLGLWPWPWSCVRRVLHSIHLAAKQIPGWEDGSWRVQGWVGYIVLALSGILSTSAHTARDPGSLWQGHYHFLRTVTRIPSHKAWVWIGTFTYMEKMTLVCVCVCVCVCVKMNLLIYSFGQNWRERNSECGSALPMAVLLTQRMRQKSGNLHMQI